MPRSLLLLEFLAIFVALPLAYWFSPLRIPALPLLWLVAGYALTQLLRVHTSTAPVSGTPQHSPHMRLQS